MCSLLEVSPPGYYKYKKSLNKPPKHAALLAAIKAILDEDECNDTYGRERLQKALEFKGFIISATTLARVCKENGLLQKIKKSKGLTKADKEAYKNDDLLQKDFKALEPNKKFVGDITQLPTRDGTLYISGVFDCFDNECSGISMADHMRSDLVEDSFKMAIKGRKLHDAVFHSDRGSQYTSIAFRTLLNSAAIKQSMSHAKSSCYGNAKCESMFARFKEELIYGRYDTKNMSMDEVRGIVFRYFMGYWNNRRICSAIGGMPPEKKRGLYYLSHNENTAS